MRVCSAGCLCTQVSEFVAACVHILKNVCVCAQVQPQSEAVTKEDVLQLTFTADADMDSVLLSVSRGGTSVGFKENKKKKTKNRFFFQFLIRSDESTFLF